MTVSDVIAPITWTMLFSQLFSACSRLQGAVSLPQPLRVGDDVHGGLERTVQSLLTQLMEDAACLRGEGRCRW